MSTAIEKIEEATCDQYRGTAADLIAAGLARADQFPPDGRYGISYLQGKQVHGNVRKDQTYLRVERFRGELMRVYVGISQEAARARKAAAEGQRRRRYEAEAQQERAKAAERAKRNLKSVFRSEDEYRRSLVEKITEMLGIMYGESDKPKDWHAYRLDQESKEAVLLAGDAVVEAIMQSTVHFDVALHARIVEGYQATIKAADPSFYAHLDKLVAPNPSILEGEAS
ncbi:hypothetical protein [Variovorax sp. dw_308]|uniref:hypothetical protein n=1 Tax=Variovorax sp. dw_308 TaxID=2721546 RepID=UPI001C45295A|nr:hypothetical protein [Variovorax sp. dw_308]